MKSTERIVARPNPKRRRTRGRRRILTVSWLAIGGIGLTLLRGPNPATAAGTDPASQADELLARVERRASKTEKADVSEIMKKSRQLINDARAEGVQPEVARVRGEAALEWAGVASDWLTALSKESDAEAREREVAKAQTELNHVRALLEETEARHKRAEGLLRQLLSERGAEATPGAPPPGANAESDDSPATREAGK